MSEREQVEIVMVEQRGDVEKVADGFRLPITYVLADGRRIETGNTSRRKRDAVAYAATLPAPPEHPTSANFTDGRYVGTRTTFYIGPRS